ncbi:MAG: hypothetical protein IJI58_02465 [Bacilli bacterium]|nr:hypothetical protein [Bacilli bacterium]
MGDRLNTNYDEIERFVIEYHDIFDEHERKHLLNYALRGHSNGKMIPDLVTEVYDKLNILEDEKNIYLGFMNLLDSEFNYRDRYIIEVGGGVIPGLARRIANEQITGKIKVYDPRLSKYERNSEKLTLVREKFYSETPIGSANLLIGFMPCEATYNIIDSATRNNIDFMIALCEGGPHGDVYDYFESDNDWLNAMIYMAERGVEDYNMGTLEKAYLKEYHNPYPVIYNKRK